MEMGNGELSPQVPTPTVIHNGLGEAADWRPVASKERSYAEYHFGVCTAEMLEDIPKECRAKLKAKILDLVANAITNAS